MFRILRVTSTLLLCASLAQQSESFPISRSCCCDPVPYYDDCCECGFIRLPDEPVLPLQIIQGGPGCYRGKPLPYQVQVPLTPAAPCGQQYGYKVEVPALPCKTPALNIGYEVETPCAPCAAKLPPLPISVTVPACASKSCQPCHGTYEVETPCAPCSPRLTNLKTQVDRLVLPCPCSAPIHDGYVPTEPRSERRKRSACWQCDCDADSVEDADDFMDDQSSSRSRRRNRFPASPPGRRPSFSTNTRVEYFPASRTEQSPRASWRVDRDDIEDYQDDFDSGNDRPSFARPQQNEQRIVSRDMPPSMSMDSEDSVPEPPAANRAPSDSSTGTSPDPVGNRLRDPNFGNRRQSPGSQSGNRRQSPGSQSGNGRQSPGSQSGNGRQSSGNQRQSSGNRRQSSDNWRPSVRDNSAAQNRTLIDSLLSTVRTNPQRNGGRIQSGRGSAQTANDWRPPEMMQDSSSGQNRGMRGSNRPGNSPKQNNSNGSQQQDRVVTPSTDRQGGSPGQERITDRQGGNQMQGQNRITNRQGGSQQEERTTTPNTQGGPRGQQRRPNQQRQPQPNRTQQSPAESQMPNRQRRRKCNACAQARNPAGSQIASGVIRTPQETMTFTDYMDYPFEGDPVTGSFMQSPPNRQDVMSMSMQAPPSQSPGGQAAQGGMTAGRNQQMMPNWDYQNLMDSQLDSSRIVTPDTYAESRINNPDYDFAYYYDY